MTNNNREFLSEEIKKYRDNKNFLDEETEFFNRDFWQIYQDNFFVCTSDNNDRIIVVKIKEVNKLNREEFTSKIKKLRQIIRNTDLIFRYSQSVFYILVREADIFRIETIIQRIATLLKMSSIEAEAFL